MHRSTKHKRETTLESRVRVRTYVPMVPQFLPKTGAAAGFEVDLCFADNAILVELEELRQLDHFGLVLETNSNLDPIARHVYHLRQVTPYGLPLIVRTLSGSEVLSSSWM